MAAKLATLAVVILVFSSHAINDSADYQSAWEDSKIPTMINMDFLTAKETERAFEEAFNEELPGLEETRRLGMQQHLADVKEHSKSSNTAESSKGKQAIPMPDDHVTEFEKDVTELIIGLSRSGFGATPMGDSVQKIKDLLEKDMVPKVLAAHNNSQHQLYVLANASLACKTTKDDAHTDALKYKTTYTTKSPLHKTCRTTESGLYTETHDAWEDMTAKKKIKDDKCKFYAQTSKRVGEQTTNKQIVAKSASESVEAYVKRISQTICGKPGGKGTGGWGDDGFVDDYLEAKEACEKATKAYNDAHTKFTDLDKKWHAQRKKCDNIQDEMDNAACKYATAIKDSCETYAECYKAKKAAFVAFESLSRKEETDRKAEWRGLKRMTCLIDAFTDGSVTAAEINTCQATNHSTDHLNLTYPVLLPMDKCDVPVLYPYTAQYKQAEFTPLPTNAKGKLMANECHGVKAIDTTPAPGSPASCKCSRVTLNGPYKGAMVKCTECFDVRRSTERNSCPQGTKLFSPKSRLEWDTFLKSAGALRAPNWIIDITRPQNGCGGCTNNFMNSGVSAQSTWRTEDGTAWWLRSTKYNEPNGDYHANCYLDLWHNPANADSVTWNDLNCGYHSKSYYCQTTALSLTPAPGSPSGCECKDVQLVGSYTAGRLLRCTKCLKVYKSTEQNSCPAGTKLFSPQSRADWKTFLSSASQLRDPYWIIDITRPQNGCGGCTGNTMTSTTPAQATWKTKDGSPWWLRSTRYNEPNGDYQSNCYLDLWHAPSNEDSVTWNDLNCKYHSKSYYCQSKAGQNPNLYKSTAPPWQAPVVDTTPGAGSPASCKCSTLTLKGSYSVGALLKCQDCLQVYRSTQTNSCPQGTKLFAPQSREDWKTFFASGGTKLYDPHWIVDVTRPQNGCGGCTGYPMSSATAQQATWKTKDGAPWWFRSNTYSEPNGDYTANCYLDLWQNPTQEDNIKWNDGNCNYRSKSYYCQPTIR